MLESKVLLKQTSFSISEILFSLSQIHESNFVRFFKSKPGISPGEYRKITRRKDNLLKKAVYNILGKIGDSCHFLPVKIEYLRPELT
ncbi:MAG: hypothetical protein HPY62_02255 [Bacteroidales bacterium]|nr:hypothetical protein [Bacteroidales bacterium]